MTSCFMLARGLQATLGRVPAGHCVEKQKAVLPKILIRRRIYFSPVRGFSTSRHYRAYSLKLKAETALGAFILAEGVHHMSCSSSVV